jgi:hypothetical protein
MATRIFLPREHDSFSDIAIGNERLLIRFTYNATFDYWSFGLYEQDRAPIIEFVKIVPNFPLTLFVPMRRFEGLHFIAETHLERIGYSDFWEDDAVFVMVEGFII